MDLLGINAYGDLGPVTELARKHWPKPIDGLIRHTAGRQVEFTAPQASGPYRIFVTILDGEDHAAYGNVPFFVQGE